MTTLARPSLGRYRTRLKPADGPSRAIYIADKYAPILIGSVLEVGRDGKDLAKLVHQPFRYAGIQCRTGAAGAFDLDRAPLPFADRQFDTVVSTGVLERLDRCHETFDELCRVARCRLIVSISNPLRLVLESVLRGSGGRAEGLGLAAEPHADRLRWFFGHEQAVEFVTGRAHRCGFEVEQMDTEEEPLPAWGVIAREALADPNIAGGAAWFVLRRAGGQAD